MSEHPDEPGPSPWSSAGAPDAWREPQGGYGPYGAASPFQLPASGGQQDQNGYPGHSGYPGQYGYADQGHPGPAPADQGHPGPAPAGYPYGAPVPGSYPSGQPAAHPASRPASHPAPGAPQPVHPTGYPPRPGVQRPAVIGIAASLAITASLEFLVLLGFGVLLAVSVMSSFSYTEQPEAAIYHLADAFQVALSQGLAIALVGFPLASTVSGFLLIARRPWARIVHTVLGVGAIGWSAWWLRDHLAFWAPTTVYIVIGVLILWLPGVSRWYATRPDRTGGDPTGSGPVHPGGPVGPGRTAEQLRF